MNKQNYKWEVLKIAIPIMLSSIINQIQMLIDRIFLGKLDVVYMSAVGNATTPMWTSMSVVFSLTVGATILASQAIGKNKKDKAIEYMASLIKYNNVIAFFLFLFWTFCSRLVYKAMGVGPEVIDYAVMYTVIYAPIFIMIGLGASINSLLQISSHTKPMLIIGFIRSMLNIVLDWAMIFGHLGFPAMGIKGAAIATTVAEFIGGIIYLFIITNSKHIEYRPSLKQIISAKFKLYAKSVKLGIPTASEDFAWNFGNLMLVKVLNAISSIAAGVYTIVFSIEILPVVFFGALGNATLTLTGKETGKKDFVQFHRIVNTVILWSIIFSAVILLCFMGFPKQLLGLFTKDVSILSAAFIYLTIVGIDLFPKSLNIIIGSGIRGYGDTKWMLYTQLFGTVFVISVASVFVFVFKLGIAGVFAAVVFDESVRCSINAIRYKRIGKKNE